MLETQDEKRRRVLVEGKPVRYVVCPLCGLNRVLDKNTKGRIRWDTVNPETALILQTRCGGGRNSGFYLDDTNSLTIEEMITSPEYDEIIDAIQQQAERILRTITQSQQG